MYVCICHRISDSQIRAAVERGASTIEDVRRELKLGAGCGVCVEFAERLIEDALPRLQAAAG
jgi:bacterioferritin-associated ferredoxin